MSMVLLSKSSVTELLFIETHTYMCECVCYVCCVYVFCDSLYASYLCADAPAVAER